VERREFWVRLKRSEITFSFKTTVIPIVANLKKNNVIKNIKLSIGTDWFIAAGVFPGFCRMKRLGGFYSPWTGC